MKAIYIVPLILIVGALRLTMRRRRRVRNQSAGTAGTGGSEQGTGEPLAHAPNPHRTRQFAPAAVTGDIALVAVREIHERLRGRIFRVGTVVILAVVAAAILIPKLDNSSSSSAEEIGVVGGLSSPLRSAIATSAKSVGTTYHYVTEKNLSSMRTDLRTGRLDLAVVDGRTIEVPQPINFNTDTSTTAALVGSMAVNMGVTQAFENAGLTQQQATEITGAKALPVASLQGGKATVKPPVNATSVIGLILIFVMLNQYNTWILMGVMEEKSSRVVEVLLAAVRPVQLLAGKVLGIGLVALAQATLIVAFALILAEAVGSPILHGAGIVTIASTLVWLILGYAFYCWVYAAAGSMAERQDQVQSLAFPLSLPVIVGYIVSLTAITSGNPSLLVKVLAYVPLTAPFAMTALVGASDVQLWQFVVSALISIAATYGVAQLAAVIYRRAILRTGRRLRYRDVMSSTSA